MNGALMTISRFDCTLGLTSAAVRGDLREGELVLHPDDDDGNNQDWAEVLHDFL